MADPAAVAPAAAALPAQQSVLFEFLPHALQTFKREPALALTLGYVLVAMAGIFYNFSFYRRFGVPILTLSQISDFLVAGLQQPVALLLVVSTFPLCWVADKINMNRRRRRARQREALLRSTPDSRLRRVQLFALGSPPRWFTACVYLGIIIIYAWIFVNFYAGHRADAVRRGEAQQVTIWLGGDAAALAAGGGAGSWTYLGAVSNYVFVYDRAADRSVILPVNSIARIAPLPSAAARVPGTVAPIP
jgi:hypothetical protein